MTNKVQQVYIPGTFTSIVLGIIVSLSVIQLPEAKDPGILPHTDKIVHAGMYCTLTLAWLWEKRRDQISDIRILFTIGGLIFLFGLAMEGVQKLLPHRNFAFDDLAANLVGVVAGIAVYVAIYRYWRDEKK